MSKSNEELAAIMLSGWLSNPNYKTLTVKNTVNVYQALCNELNKSKVPEKK